jgi:2-polyprenyl-3-methyl-5-hydroxy-6-metoxy-1,4-benzoquinol methylase
MMTTSASLINSQPTTPPFDADKAEAFVGRLLATLNAGGLSMMISIGHRTHLFDALAELPPATSQQIAAAAGLHERYVREWLNAMTVGGIIHYEAPHQTYHLPAEHAAFLTRAVKADNFAVYFQHIGSLGSVEAEIADCFFNGGGVPYSHFPRFHEVMAEDSGLTIVDALEDHILPAIPEVVERLARGIEVLDIGCGQGRAITKLARLFPASQFTGYDLLPEVVTVANAQVQAEGLNNVQFKVQDAEQIDECDHYDLITTFDAIHDQAHPDIVLRNIHRALRSDGVYLMQDIGASSHVDQNLEHPLAPFLYTISCMHCMTVSLAAGGMGLGTMWGRELALKMLKEAGFQQIDRLELTHDPMNDYYVIRKGGM